MRILLVAALIGSAVFESHQIAGQTSAPLTDIPVNSNLPIKGDAQVAGDAKTSR